MSPCCPRLHFLLDGDGPAGRPRPGLVRSNADERGKVWVSGRDERAVVVVGDVVREKRDGHTMREGECWSGGRAHVDDVVKVDEAEGAGGDGQLCTQWRERDAVCKRDPPVVLRVTLRCV